MYPIQGPLTVDDHFADGDVQTGRDATDMNAKFLNDVQDEILNAVEDSGQTPSPDDQSQLSKAINLRGFHVFDGASAALDSDTGIPSGKVKNAVVVLHNASASTVDGFQFPSPANCQNLGMVIVVPDWSGTGASEPTASVVINQSSGGTLPVFNGNIFIAVFNGNGVLTSAKTLSIPYRGNKTFSEIGKLVVDGDLRVISTALFESAVEIRGILTASGLVVNGDIKSYGMINSSGYLETAGAVGNAPEKPMLINGIAHSLANYSAQIGKGKSIHFTNQNMSIARLNVEFSLYQILTIVNTNPVNTSSPAPVEVEFKYDGSTPYKVVIPAGCAWMFVRTGGGAWGSEYPNGYIWHPLCVSAS